MPAKQAAVQAEELAERLAAVRPVLPSQDIRAVMRSFPTNEMQSRNSQIAKLADVVLETVGVRLSGLQLGQMFNIKAEQVYKILSKDRRNPASHPGRPFSLTDGEELRIIQEISRRGNENDFMSRSDILDWIRNFFGKDVTLGWLAGFLERSQNQIRPTKTKPQEELRLQVPHRWLLEYVSLIQKIVPNVPCELIFNIDETGNCD
jgi:hypothetical protein